jgi:hypothetical protein
MTDRVDPDRVVRFDLELFSACCRMMLFEFDILAIPTEDPAPAAAEDFGIFLNRGCPTPLPS